MVGGERLRGSARNGGPETKPESWNMKPDTGRRWEGWQTKGGRAETSRRQCLDGRLVCRSALLRKGIGLSALKANTNLRDAEGAESGLRVMVRRATVDGIGMAHAKTRRTD